jgi:hypothetical protein
MNPALATRTPPRVRLVGFVDGRDTHHDTAVTDFIEQCEVVKAHAGDTFEAHVLVDRVPDRPGRTLARGLGLGLLTYGLPVALGTAALLAASPALGVAAALSAIPAWRSPKTGRALQTLDGIRCGIEGLRSPEPRWSGRRAYKIKASTTPAIDSAVIHEECVPSKIEAAPLTRFLVEQMRPYPSSLLLLSVHGHGYGAYNVAGMGGAVFARILADTTKQLGRPIDVLHVGSCLQGNLESLAAMAPYARYAVVSEDVLGDHTAARSLSAGLKAPIDPGLDARGLADRLFDAGRTMRHGLGNEVLTLALVDMQKIPSLVRAVDRFGATLADEVRRGAWRPLKDLAASDLQFPAYPLARGLCPDSFTDLAGYATRVRDAYAGQAKSPRTEAVIAAAEEVLRAEAEAVPRSWQERGYEHGEGISIQLLHDHRDHPSTPPGWSAFNRSLKAAASRP